jgi:TnpA family transposase
VAGEIEGEDAAHIDVPVRTLYLCDYLGSPAFRDEILALLNQGEAVHSLQRAIQQGPIGARRGRTPQQLAAVSGALTLLANLVMACA